MKYALAVAGLLAVVGLVGAFRVSPLVAVSGAVIILVLMVAMVVFARLTTVGRSSFLLPAQVMMWSFLLLIIATAFLLFTCAFFQWPKSLDNFIPNSGSGTNNGAAATSVPPARVVTMIEAARLQLAAGDNSGGWNLISEAVRLAPDYREAREVQVDIAMASLQYMRITEPATFTEAVKPLVEGLYQGLVGAKGTRAADIHAHIGWANATKYRETGDERGIETEYAEAIKLDPTNPYAHAMWGHWLAYQWKPLPEITNHFYLAHQTGRASNFVAHLEIYALAWDRGDLERARGLVRLADRLRQAHINMDLETREEILRVVYQGHGKDHTDEVVAMLPPEEHLVTFHWVVKGWDLTNGAPGFFDARLTEATGDKAGALAKYRSLAPYNYSFDEQIKQGIARCQK